MKFFHNPKKLLCCLTLFTSLGRSSTFFYSSFQQTLNYKSSKHVHWQVAFDWIFLIVFQIWYFFLINNCLGLTHKKNINSVKKISSHLTESQNPILELKNCTSNFVHRYSYYWSYWRIQNNIISISSFYSVSIFELNLTFKKFIRNSFLPLYVCSVTWHIRIKNFSY